jgi:hypothetical protein
MSVPMNRADLEKIATESQTGRLTFPQLAAKQEAGVTKIIYRTSVKGSVAKPPTCHSNPTCPREAAPIS